MSGASAAPPGAPFARRRRAPWLVFGLCALLVVDVLAWASWRVLALERAEQRARAQADAAQLERLALWQMDSLVSALIARESARPYFEFRAVYAADLPYAQAWAIDEASGVRTSALAGGTGDPLVRLHYQIDPDGSVASPQAAQPRGETPDPDRLRASRSLQVLAGLVVERSKTEMAVRSIGQIVEESGGDRLAYSDANPEVLLVEPGARAGADERLESVVGATLDEAVIADADSDGIVVGQAQVSGDADLRQQLFDMARSGNAVFEAQRQGPDESGATVEVGLFQPRWLGDGGEEPELVFERTVVLGEQRFRQGVWIDWPGLRARLLAASMRLVPGSELEPIVRPPSRASSADTLATIPLRLRVPSREIGPAVWTPARVTLAVSWIAAVVALISIGVVLRTAMRLADRRGRFVAAVTHELRSPLTSLRLHTDLLERARDDYARRAHTAVLRQESGRLGEVIENVLVYAGMRGATASQERTSVGAIVEPLLEGFRSRAASSGMAFVGSVAEDAADAVVRVRPGSVQRVLTNLVENACRYGIDPSAKASDDPPIGSSIGLAVDLGSGPRGRRVVRMRVWDQGPGVGPSERDAIFNDFYRGAASGGVHRGMGLGLALGRALARAEGGELRLLDRPSDRGRSVEGIEQASGAVFELTIPVDADGPNGGTADGGEADGG